MLLWPPAQSNQQMRILSFSVYCQYMIDCKESANLSNNSNLPIISHHKLNSGGGQGMGT